MLSENRRVDATVAALRVGDLEAVGRLLDASHASLRDDYEASVPEVEATVAELKRAGAAGARMMGGGFGGAVLALLPRRNRPPRRRHRRRPRTRRPPPLSSADSGRISAQATNSSPNTSMARPA